MQLFCPATGIPPADINWLMTVFFDEKKVSNATATIGGIPTKVLSIEQKDNSTEYTCIAHNIAGLDTRTVNVRTLSKPTRKIMMHTSVILSVFMFHFLSYQQSQLFRPPHRSG